MNAELRKYLEQIAGRKCWSDDQEQEIADWANGDTEMAYSGGYDDGQAELAREVLEMFDHN